MTTLPIQTGAAPAGGAGALTKIIGGTLAVLFYLSITAFIVFLILVFVHYAIYPIFNTAGEGGTTAGDGDATYNPYVYPTSKAPSDTAILPRSTDTNALSSTNYTIAFDTYITGAFINDKVPQILLYRKAVNAAAPSTYDLTAGHPFATETTTPNSNIFVWLDPVKNDLYAGVVMLQSDNTTKYMKMTAPIENLPVRQPFRVSLMLTEKLLELYVNGKFQRSIVLPNTPINCEDPFFATPNVIAGTTQDNSAYISNIKYWNTPLSARAIMTDGQPLSSANMYPKT
jgi:hypothetical protein